MFDLANLRLRPNDVPSTIRWLTRGVASMGLALVIVSTAAGSLSGPKAYVGNFKDNTVSVVDLATARVLMTVPVAVGPDGMVATPDGASVYVSGSSASTVSVIDTRRNQVVANVEVGQGPQGLVMLPGGKQMLVAVNGDDRVAIVDVATNRVIGTVPVPKPHTIAVDAAGTRAYVASQRPGDFAIVVIDIATRSVVGRIALEQPPRDLEFSHDGKVIYLTLAGVAALQVIDPQLARIVAQVPTGVSPHVAQHYAGVAQTIAVVQGPGELQLFDPVSGRRVRSIAVGKQPHWMDITADAKRLAVSNEGDNTLSVVDLATGQVNQVAVGNAPRKVVVQPTVTTAPNAASSEVVISIANFQFMPMETVLRPGQTVRWQNDDGAPHGLAFKDGADGEPVLLPGKSFTRRFDRPGTYDYVCSVHPYMTARVVVKE